VLCGASSKGVILAACSHHDPIRTRLAAHRRRRRGTLGVRRVSARRRPEFGSWRETTSRNTTLSVGALSARRGPYIRSGDLQRIPAESMKMSYYRVPKTSCQLGTVLRSWFSAPSAPPLKREAEERRSYPHRRPRTPPLGQSAL
jgi:hypothetical protein